MGQSEFQLIGKVSTDDLQTAKTEGLSVLNGFFDKISIFYNVPIESLTISDTKLELKNGTNSTISGSSIEAKCAITAKDEDIDDFKAFLNNATDDALLLLDMLKRCKSENPNNSFWTMYNIFLILIGERKEIDKYLKENFPELPTLHNDNTNEDNTVFIALRDSHSHKTTYSGKPLDIETELRENLGKFRRIARETIIKLLDLKIELGRGSN